MDDAQCMYILKYDPISPGAKQTGAWRDPHSIGRGPGAGGCEVEAESEQGLIV